MSQEVQYTNNLRDIIREEYKKCASDAVYFMKKYVKIQHQERGIIPFDTYPFQDETLKELQESSRNIILKSRQMGISTLVAAYALWTMLFNEGKNILVLSIKQDTAKELVVKVKLAYNHLPSWLKIPCVENSALMLKLSNQSKIMAASSASDSARSFSASILILDEAAFIDNAEEVWTAAQQTLATVKGNAIILSTPNGVGNFFHKLWIESELGKNTFNRIKLPWYKHPERNQEWRDKQTRDLGAKQAAQECDTEFLTSGNTVVDLEIIKDYQDHYATEPKEKHGSDKNYWYWSYPQPGKSYILTADCARGDGEDYSAFHVFDIDTLEQCAEYKGKIDTTSFGRELVAAAVEWNMALLVIERENVGWAVIQEVINMNYPNLFYSSPEDIKIVDVNRSYTNKINTEEKKMKPGFSTTMKSRPLIIDKMVQYLRERSFIVKSNRLLDELTVFIWNNHRPEAMKGYNDDLVMSLAIGLWVRDVALEIRTQGIDLTKFTLNNISRFGNSTPPIIKTRVHQTGYESWNMKIGNNPESLTWLL